MVFRDRKDAGEKLAKELVKYKNHPDTVVLGLPRGGVVTAYEIARALNLPLDVIVIRKVGAPGNPELAIGAVDDKGHGMFNEDIVLGLGVDEEYIEKAKKREQDEAHHRLKIFRGGRAPLDLKGKTVILVDDGLATGATMRAAVAGAKAKGAKKTVVAIPVAARDSVRKVEEEADEVVCLDAPSYFGAVSLFYEHFSQTTDEEVIEILKLT